MTEAKQKSVSVVVPTSNGRKLAAYYLPQLCAYMEEQSGVKQYEIVVTDDNPTEDMHDMYAREFEKVRYLRSKPDCGFVSNANTGIFASCMDYLLLLTDNTLPASNYFDETLPYFDSVNNVFGISATTFGVNGSDILEGARMPLLRYGNIFYADNFSASKPCTSFCLSLRNMLVDRKKLSMMGGFNLLFNPEGQENMDLSLRAWRISWKCIYTPLTSCKRIEPNKKEEPAKNIYRANTHRANQFLLNYLHSNGPSHTLFMIHWVCLFLVSFFWPTSGWRGYRKASFLFLHIFREAHSQRHWQYVQIHNTVNVVCNLFFPNRQNVDIQDLRKKI